VHSELDGSFWVCPLLPRVNDVADHLAQTDFAQEPVFMACEDPTVSPLVPCRNEN